MEDRTAFSDANSGGRAQSAQMPLKLNHTLNNQLARFFDDEMLPRHQSDDSVRALLDSPNKLGIENKLLSIESCDGDHNESFNRLSSQDQELLKQLISGTNNTR